MRLDIKDKYAICIISLLLFVVLILCGLSYIQTERVSSASIDSSSQLMNTALLEEMERRGVVISQLLSESLINPLYNLDMSGMQDLIAAYKTHPNIDDIVVYDAAGGILHDGTESVVRYGRQIEKKEYIESMSRDIQPRVDRRAGSVVIHHPILLDRTMLGGVRVELSLSEIHHTIAVMERELSEIHDSVASESRRYIAAAAAAAVLLGLILAYILAARISIPIKKMAALATRVGRGDYDNRIDYRSNDEVGELIEALHRMQDNLKESTISIQELEKEVENRTHELAAANEDLRIHKEQLEIIVSERTAKLRETNRNLKKEIEDRRSMQQRLIRAEKMEAIGTVAAGVAHDLNNILSGIVGIPDLILMDLPKESPLADEMAMIKKSGMKAAAVVQDLLNLARKNVVRNHVLELDAVVRAYLQSREQKEILANFPNVKIRADIRPQPVRIYGSKMHLSKALMNLVANAAESMPEGGTITISLDRKPVEPCGGKSIEIPKGDYAVLRVEDCGEGIPPENLEHVFEPFYTTKAMGRSGSGLGLTVVKETVKDHQGFIDVQSAPGRGTVFTLYFPATEAELPEKRKKEADESYRGKGESILIVDDLESQRALLKSMLDKLGYSAFCSPSGEDAVEYLKANSADLIILDMIMGSGMDGLDTFKQILQFRPRQKVIIASGYSESERVKQLQGLGGGAYIRKPYTVKQICRAVRAELDR